MTDVTAQQYQVLKAMDYKKEAARIKEYGLEHSKGSSDVLDHAYMHLRKRRKRQTR